MLSVYTANNKVRCLISFEEHTKSVSGNLEKIPGFHSRLLVKFLREEERGSTSCEGKEDKGKGGTKSLDSPVDVFCVSCPVVKLLSC